jgi:hypothetical protein
LAAAKADYGVGEGDGEVFFVVSFFVVEESVDFLVVEVVAASFFWVDDFLVVDSVLAGALVGVVVVDSDLVVHELISPAANKAVME